MERLAIHLKIRAGFEQEYDRLHEQVWPELIADLRAAGVVEYSIFRQGLELFLLLRVRDTADFENAMRQSEANARWQKMMGPFWDGSPPSTPSTEMREVFYLQPIEP